MLTFGIKVTGPVRPTHLPDIIALAPPPAISRSPSSVIHPAPVIVVATNPFIDISFPSTSYQQETCSEQLFDVAAIGRNPNNFFDLVSTESVAAPRVDLVCAQTTNPFHSLASDQAYMWPDVTRPVADMSFPWSVPDGMDSMSAHTSPWTDLGGERISAMTSSPWNGTGEIHSTAESLFSMSGRAPLSINWFSESLCANVLQCSRLVLLKS